MSGARSAPEILLRLLRQCKTFAVHFFQNHVAAALQKNVAGFVADFDRVVAFARFAQNLCPIRMRNQGIQMNFAILDLGKCADRHLATAAQLVQQSPFARSRAPRRRVIELC